MPLVVDASTALNWVIEQPLSEAAARVHDMGEELVAPAFMPLESANALWSQVRQGLMTAQDALARLDDIESGGVRFDDPPHPASGALRLACLVGDTSYDCVYLALALELDCRLVTADAVFAEMATAAGFGDRILLLGTDL